MQSPTQAPATRRLQHHTLCMCECCCPFWCRCCWSLPFPTLAALLQSLQPQGRHETCSAARCADAENRGEHSQQTATLLHDCHSESLLPLLLLPAPLLYCMHSTLQGCVVVPLLLLQPAYPLCGSSRVAAVKHAPTLEHGCKAEGDEDTHAPEVDVAVLPVDLQHQAPVQCSSQEAMSRACSVCCLFAVW